MYTVCFLAVVFLALAIRIVPVFNNTFPFAGDETRDALFVRDILVRHEFPLMGPVTSVSGIYAGPGWYYFTAIGYFLFGGHPFGPMFLLILLNICLTALIMKKIANNVSPPAAIIAGLGLQVSWGYYLTSRQAAAAYSLVFLAWCIVFLLADALRGQRKRFLFSSMFVGAAFHSEIVGATLLLLFHSSVGLWALAKKIITLRYLFFSYGIAAIFFLPHIIFELQTNFSQTHHLLREILLRQTLLLPPVVSSMHANILGVISNAVFPQLPYAGLVLLVLVMTFLLLATQRDKGSTFTVYVYFLIILLIGISFVFYSINHIWRYWQTIYLGPLTFFAVVLALFRLPTVVRYPLLTVVLLSHVVYFSSQLDRSANATGDLRILKNQLTAIDWMYQHASGSRFTFMNRHSPMYDYSFEYLFWWYGRKKYGYLPCHLDFFPFARSFHVPERGHYRNPARDCDNGAENTAMRFTLIDGSSSLSSQKQWRLTNVQGDTITTIIVDDT